MGEIVSGIGFDSSNICVFYEIQVPEGWKMDDFNDYDTLGLAKDQSSEINRMKSTTQWSEATVRHVDNAKVFVSNFSFPFDYQFLKKRDSDSALPHLMFQVNSVDWLGRNRIEGYGYL